MDKREGKEGSDLTQRGLWRLMLKLPALRGRLQILAQKSMALKELCEAYEEAAMAHERLLKEGTTRSRERALEYGGICLEIETDIIELVLEQSKGVPD